MIDAMSRRSSGQTGVEMPALKGYGLPLPSLPEQRAIATALSDVDALLTKLDQFIVKKRDLKQAAMQQLLTGQTRLPGFGGEWEVKQVEGCIFNFRRQIKERLRCRRWAVLGCGYGVGFNRWTTHRVEDHELFRRLSQQRRPRNAQR